MAQILVIGGSKGIGLATVKAALARGHRVRAFARSAGAIPIDHPALEEMAGDALKPIDIARAVAGVDAVVMALGIANPFSLQPATLFSKATRLLIPAMRAAGVSRLICITGLGAGDSRGKGSLVYTKLFFPLVLARIYEDKDVQEQFVRESGLEWTILRPGLLTNGPATGRARVVTDPAQWRDASISRADVAEVIVSEIENPRYVHQAPVVIV
ncbi:MAG: SDR family oxidoreductase [Hyphomicrobiaceae bacterium]